MENKMKKLILILSAMILLIASCVLAADVVLTWEKPDDARVTGYEVYVDNFTVPYASIEGADILSADFSNLSIGEHVFMARSHDANGNQSVDSDHLHYWVQAEPAVIGEPPLGKPWNPKAKPK